MEAPKLLASRNQWNQICMHRTRPGRKFDLSPLRRRVRLSSYSRESARHFFFPTIERKNSANRWPTQGSNKAPRRVNACSGHALRRDSLLKNRRERRRRRAEDDSPARSVIRRVVDKQSFGFPYRGQNRRENTKGGRKREFLYWFPFLLSF